MIYPAGRGDVVGFLPYRFLGNCDVSKYSPLSGGRFNANTGQTYKRTSAIPDGYSAGGAYALPVVAGGMSSAQAYVTVTGESDGIAASVISGNGDITVTSAGDVSLIMSLGGAALTSFSGAAGLALTISLAGDVSVTFLGEAALSMIIPVSGAGSWAVTGSGDLRGQLDMEGSWTPYTDLSPQTLAAAVWSALAAQNNEAGTMGDLLNAAGGGGISGAVIDQIADAVWQSVGANGNQYGATLTSAEKWAKIAAALSA